jgi:uncharacterized protein
LNDTVNEDAALQGAKILLPNGLTKIFLFVNSCDACTSNHYNKVVKPKETKCSKFNQYFDWSEPLTKAPSHRLLAMLRAENEVLSSLKSK